MRWCLLFFGLVSAGLPAAESVRYCDYPVYPPISWSDGQQVRGLGPRVVKAVLDDLGLPMQTVVLGNWQRCLLDAQSGRVDMLLAYRNPEREHFLVFAQTPVLREEVALFFNRAKPVDFTRLADLERYRGGLLVGESYGADFDHFVASHGNIEYVSSNRQNFGKLIRQRIDFIAHERRTGLLFVERLPGGEQIDVAEQPITIDFLHLALSRSSPLRGRLDEIERSLARLQDEGLVLRWLAESEREYRAFVSHEEQP